MKGDKELNMKSNTYSRTFLEIVTLRTFSVLGNWVSYIQANDVTSWKTCVWLIGGSR